ncbi:MAG: VIT1/CCC1 transporter family protein [Actinomycetales bacterium]|nr:VIT1/CCC1 transporter family protein [Actinomycetales bacterium]
MIPPEHHRDVTGGWLRPAVFGAMDGLVSNFALMLGVIGGVTASSIAADERGAILTAGFAGLAAGAFSMAAGEYVSVASQSELGRAELELERREIARNPEHETAELAAMWAARGVEPALAQEVAAQLMRDPEMALEVHAREELGFSPNDLPDPRLAAVSSFLAFAVGALVPLLPYLLGAATPWPTIIISLIGLFGAGALVSRVTVRSWWYSGIRQLLLGAAAAGLTFALGSLLGTVAL